jgi:dTDP-4-dehydrorhamnose reductase
VSKLLVTGASGLLGGALARRAAADGWDVVGTRLTHPAAVRSVRLDVRDAGAVDALLAAEAPDAVIHTAYRQHGPGAAAVNVDGAAHVAAAAARAGARLVHLSTDVVFGGREDRPLREDDPVDPVTDYGRAKAAAETAVAAACPAALIVRTSLLYTGPPGPPSPHEELAVAAARGERPATFFADELRCPIQVGDLAAALLELAGAHDAGILHVAGADTVDRHTFATLVAEAWGVPAGALVAGPAPPDRPRACALDTGRARRRLATRLRGVREVLAPAGRAESAPRT